MLERTAEFEAAREFVRLKLERLCAVIDVQPWASHMLIDALALLLQGRHVHIVTDGGDGFLRAHLRNLGKRLGIEERVQTNLAIGYSSAPTTWADAVVLSEEPLWETCKGFVPVRGMTDEHLGNAIMHGIEREGLRNPRIADLFIEAVHRLGLGA